MDKVKEQIERLKCKANFFLMNSIKTFIVDTSDDYYFCEILSFDENYIYVKHFTGKRIGEEDKILWFDIIKFEEYEERI